MAASPEAQASNSSWDPTHNWLTELIISDFHSTSLSYSQRWDLYPRNFRISSCVCVYLFKILSQLALVFASLSICFMYNVRHFRIASLKVDFCLWAVLLGESGSVCGGRVACLKEVLLTISHDLPITGRKRWLCLLSAFYLHLKLVGLSQEAFVTKVTCLLQGNLRIAVQLGSVSVCWGGGVFSQGPGIRVLFVISSSHSCAKSKPRA